MKSVPKGRDGEAAAAAELEARGCRIVARNFRTRSGEVDLIAQDGDTLIFVEVKAWTHFGIEDLEYSINARKRGRIIETAKYFLATHREYNSMAVRFDIIFIGEAGLRYLASAFTERV